MDSQLFPFKTVREGQQEFMSDAYSTLKKGGNLLAHAPTGIGKTAAALTPALECALREGRTVFFLTPKHTQHTIVVETARSIVRKHGVKVVLVDIVGKQWTCLHSVRQLESREFNEFCKAKKREESCVYYNNVRRQKLSKRASAVVSEMKKEPLHNERVMELCSEHELCPYEVCIEAGKDANIIICDYFHLFSPPIRKAFLSKLRKTIEGSIIIVDEAHNLPERVRTLLSVNLSGYALGKAAGEAKNMGFLNLAEDFNDVGRILGELGVGLRRGDERFVECNEFTTMVEANTSLRYDELVSAAEELGDEVLSIPNRYRSYAKSVANFLKNWPEGGLGYARILRKEKYMKLSYMCLDPSISCREVFDKAFSTILMSGTLVPLKMYSSVLGLETARTEMREYPSPFPNENRLTLVVPQVTTKYSSRSDHMYRRYAELIRRIVEKTPGNAAVFYPAYQLMESVLNEMRKMSLGKRMLTEKQDMSKSQKRQLHKRLLEEKTAVLMGVQAGSLSEGVDYPDNTLDTVIIVGLPLEKPDLETNALIEYYDFKFDRGWDYGYIYPAMNRALQAAGRCIRSETDKGAIVFMDERFMWRNYSKCFPADLKLVVTEKPEEYLGRFFLKN